jgi:hypothetical protein
VRGSEHIHVEDRHRIGPSDLADHRLDNQRPGAGRGGRAAVTEDPRALLVRPFVQDPLEQLVVR